MKQLKNHDIIQISVNDGEKIIKGRIIATNLTKEEAMNIMESYSMGFKIETDQQHRDPGEPG